jgi:hypothetical protein
MTYCSVVIKVIDWPFVNWEFVVKLDPVGITVSELLGDIFTVS